MSSCEVCDIIKGKGEGIHAKENIIKLKGGWVLNHCNASNAYLGYLVIGTEKHQPYFHDLSLIELNSLGPNLKWINDRLRNYWISNFPNDSIEQIYFAYFNEKPFKNNLIGQELTTSLHVHIHILPRTNEIRKICDSKKLGWGLLDEVKNFPTYLLCDNFEKMKLIKFLKIGN